MSFRQVHFSLFLLFLLHFSLQCVAQDLVMVIFVHRHGSRTRLGKNGTTLAESNSILTPEGMTQLYKAGLTARDRYLFSPNCSVADTCLSEANLNSIQTSYIYSQSTSIDRALQSGQAFLLGLLKPNFSQIQNNETDFLGVSGGVQPVPMVSIPSSDDWILRAYADQKCPTYLNELQKFYDESPYFAQKNESTQDLRNYLANILNTEITLKDIWNVYDAYNVQRSYGANTINGGPALPEINESTWSQIKEAADWVEWNRYGNHSQAKNFCGGGLLADLTKRIDNLKNELELSSNVISSSPRIVHYSSHYGTMLSLLSAIDFTPKDPSNDTNSWIKGIPNYGSVLSFEIRYDSSSGFKIQLLFQNGFDQEYRVVNLPCSEPDSYGSCSYDAFKVFTGLNGFIKPSAWCRACGNTTMNYCAASLYFDNFLKSESIILKLDFKFLLFTILVIFFTI